MIEREMNVKDYYKITRLSNLDIQVADIGNVKDYYKITRLSNQ